MRRQRYQRVIPTTKWNRFVDFYFRNRIAQVVSDDGEPWRHPWYTRLAWDPFEEHWTARVKPAPCVSDTSDGDPTVSVPARLAPPETAERLGLDERSGDGPVDAFLSEEPDIILRPDLWRAVGTDAVVADGSEAVPAYFTERGVLGPQVMDAGGSQVVVRIRGVLADRASARLLRACDLVLTHERARTAVIAQLANLDLDEIDVDFLRDASGVRRDPYLQAVREYRDTVVPDSLSLLLGEATDDGRDSIHLATLYLLSPPGTPEGSDPDETWTSHVDHHVHWPLQYVTRFDVVEPDPTRITVPAPQLGQGQLGRIGERFAAAINESFDQLETQLVQVRNEGRFSML